MLPTVIVSSMHLALRILDIQIAIFGLLSQKRDVLSTILVCRDWQDAAEALLWKELPHLIPLLMLMPRAAWRVNKIQGSSLLLYTFVRDPYLPLSMNA